MNEIIKCPICGFETENLCLAHIKTHGYRDTLSFKKEFKISYLKSDRLRKAQSDMMRQNNPTKGKKRSASEVAKMSKNRRGKGIGNTGKYKRTPKIREKISIGVVTAHLRGDFNLAKPGNGSFIFAKKANKIMFVRSTWEKRVVDILERSNEIESFDNECLIIPYIFDGCTHNYIPDFLIRSNSGVIEIWEVKRDNLILNKDPQTMAKIEALEQYCYERGYNSRVLCLKDIEKLEKIIRKQSL